MVFPSVVPPQRVTPNPPMPPSSLPVSSPSSVVPPNITTTGPGKAGRFKCRLRILKTVLIYFSFFFILQFKLAQDLSDLLPSHKIFNLPAISLRLHHIRRSIASKYYFHASLIDFVSTKINWLFEAELQVKNIIVFFCPAAVLSLALPFLSPQVHGPLLQVTWTLISQVATTKEVCSSGKQMKLWVLTPHCQVYFTPTLIILNLSVIMRVSGSRNFSVNRCSSQFNQISKNAVIFCYLVKVGAKEPNKFRKSGEVFLQRRKRRTFKRLGRIGLRIKCRKLNRYGISNQLLVNGCY